MSLVQFRLSEAVDAYLITRRARYADATVTNEAFVVRRFAAWIGHDMQVRNLRPERVEGWFYGPGGLRLEHVTRDGRRRPPVQASTHNYYRNRLASFFRYCAQRGLLRDDPLRGVQPMTVERKLRQQPSPDRLLALLDAADNGRDRAYLATAINTALRSKEITTLRVDAVDLAGRSLSVKIHKSSDVDLLPITLDLDTELRRWLVTYAEELGRPLSSNDHLFPARRGSVYRWQTLPDGTKVQGRAPSTWDPSKPVTHTERIVKGAMASLGIEYPS